MVFALSIVAAASDNDDSFYGDRADDKNDDEQVGNINVCFGCKGCGLIYIILFRFLWNCCRSLQYKQDHRLPEYYTPEGNVVP